MRNKRSKNQFTRHKHERFSLLARLY